MNNPLFCICGKLCTSKAGLTLHQVKCKQAKSALNSGKPAIRETDIIIPHGEYEPEVKMFIDLAEEIAYDAHLALSSKNKSAGRRARTAMIKMRKNITPLRAKILESIK